MKALKGFVIAMKEIVLRADEQNIAKATEFVAENMRKHHINEHLIFEYQLLTEEILIKLLEVASIRAEFEVKLSYSRGHCTLNINCDGSPVKLFTHDSLGSVILDEYSDRISQRYNKNSNRIKISTDVSSGTMLKRSLLAVIVAIIAGYLVQTYVPQGNIDFIESQVVYPLIYVFILLVDTFAYPLAFIAIVSYIMNFIMRIDGDREISIMAVKVTVTSSVGLILGYFVGRATYYLPMAGQFADFKMNVGQNYIGATLAEIIANAVPANIVDPFVGSNPLPVLILALIFGTAVSTYFGQGGDFMRQIVHGTTGLMGTIINIIYSFMPTMVFLATFHSIISFGFRIIFFYMGALFMFVLALLIMVCIQTLNLVVNGVNPIKFFKEYKPVIWNNFVIASALDALPFNRRNLCRRLKEPASLVREKLELGASIDMDGNCVVLSMGIIMMIFACNMEMGYAEVVGLLVVILLLSFGAPNRPGTFLISMLLLMNFVGISVEACSVIIIFELFTSKLVGFVNVFGTITSIVEDSQRYERRQKKLHAREKQDD